MQETLSPVRLDTIIEALCARGFQTELVADKAEALERLSSLIPAGANVMTGASLTLREIGFDDLLISGSHPWNNLKTALLAETDPARQMQMRRQSVFADYFVGSVQAITESGELVFASASGSQLAAYTFGSQHLIWVVGVQKIVPDIEAALRRLREVALPAENARMKSLGYPGSVLAKTLIFEHEPPMMGRETRLILVNEPVGV